MQKNHKMKGAYEWNRLVESPKNMPKKSYSRKQVHFKGVYLLMHQL